MRILLCLMFLFMRKIYSFLLFSLCFNLHAQISLYKVKCCVVDELSSSAISLVTVSCSVRGREISSITDYSGCCFLELPQGEHSVLFSRMGYKPLIAKVHIEGLENQFFSFLMNELSYDLDEVAVYGSLQSTKKIIKNVVANLNNKLASTRYQSTGYLRKTRMKDGLYVFYGDAQVKHINGGYAAIGHAYNTNKIINVRISDQDTSLSALSTAAFPLIGGSVLDYNQVLLPLLLNHCFDFFLLETPENINKGCFVSVGYKMIPERWSKQKSRFLMFNDRYQYGQMVIDTANWMVVNIINQGKQNSPDTGLSETYFSVTSFVDKGDCFYLQSNRVVAAYEESSLDGNSIHQIVSELKVEFFDFDSTELSIEEIKKLFQCKISVDDRFGTKSLFFSYTKPLCDKISKYDPIFWQDAPFSTIDSVIRHDLECMSSRFLEEQFADNTELLIRESKSRFGLQYSKGIMKKLLKEKYLEFKRGDLFNDCK